MEVLVQEEIISRPLADDLEVIHKVGHEAYLAMFITTSLLDFQLS